MPVAPFLSLFYDMVNDPGTDGVVCWTQDGLSVQVLDQERFTMSLLPANFGHNNFSSFARQMSSYNFRKRTSPSAVLFTQRDEYFRAGKRELIGWIGRQSSHSKGPSSKPPPQMVQTVVKNPTNCKFLSATRQMLAANYDEICWSSDGKQVVFHKPYSPKAKEIVQLHFGYTDIGSWPRTACCYGFKKSAPADHDGYMAYYHVDFQRDLPQVAIPFTKRKRAVPYKRPHKRTRSDSPNSANADAASDAAPDDSPDAAAAALLHFSSWS